MRRLRGWCLRLYGVFFTSRSERELTLELENHLDLHISDNLRAGMTPAEARRQAMLALGGVEQTKETYRDRHGFRFLDDLLHDLGRASRLLPRARGFTLTAVLVLGFGIGMSNTFFTIVNAMCIRGLTLDDPDTVMDISTRDGGGRERRMSYPDLQDIRTSTKAFAGIAAFAPRNPVPMTVGDVDRAPERFMGTYVSAATFGLIGERVLLGRDFTDADDQPNAPAVVMLGRTAWRERYHADPSVVGRTIRVNGEPALVIGVVPDRSKFPNNTAIWRPLRQMPALDPENRGTRNLSVLGRLAGNTTPAGARGELQVIAEALAQKHPETNSGFQITAEAVNDEYVVPLGNPAWITFTVVGLLVLVVACANVANLLLMRSMTRAREIAIRVSLGATRGRIIRQLLAESAVLAMVGGTLGVVLSIAGARLLWLSIPGETLPYWMTFTLDLRGLAFISTVCAGSSLLFGLGPAMHLARTGVSPGIHDGGRTTTLGTRARRWTSALLIVQFGLAMIFGVLITREIMSARAMRRGDPFMPGSTIATAAIALPAETYSTPQQRRQFFVALADRLDRLPGLSSWSFAGNLPLGGGMSQRLAIEGRTERDKESRDILTIAIGPGYFTALGLDMVRGRAFTARDGDPDGGSAIVNRRFADVFFQDQNPIGQRIRVTAEGAAPPSPWREIVGVSQTIRQRDRPDADPVVYLPARESPAAFMALIARGPAGPAEVAVALRDEVRRLDPDLPLFRVMTLAQAVEDAHWNGRISSVLALSISLIAVGLAAVGLYAVTAHAVSERLQEIGVRLALGADPWRLVWLTLRRTLAQLQGGILLGIGCAVVWDRALYTEGAIRMTALSNLIGAGLILAAIAVLACLGPVLRAMRVNPTAVLRYE